MSSITQVQNQQVNPASNSVVKKTPKDGVENADAKLNESSGPVLNKMSRQLNESEKRGGVEISEQQTQNLIPDTGVAMMGAQSGHITAEFVANLLNKNPYEN